MLDLLLEALFDVVTGKQPKQAAPLPRAGRRSEAGQGGEEPDRERPRESRAPRAMTLEDLIRKMTGTEEETPPPRREARQRKAPRKDRAEAPPPPPPPVRPPARPLVAKPLEHAPAEAARKPSRAMGGGSAYADKLRGNPQAARDAFVYAEILGRPLAERDHY